MKIIMMNVWEIMILSQYFWQWLDFRHNKRADSIPWLVEEALELLPCFSDQKV